MKRRLNAKAELYALFLGLLALAVNRARGWTSFDVDDRFQVFWNVPSAVCANTSAGLIRPRDYGIRANDGERFYGNVIVTFYEERLGYYPKCLYKKLENGSYVITQRINGGLPTMALLKAHLIKAAADIARAIPDTHFHGLAIIDYEHWRPIFAHNWGPRTVYRVEAIERAHREHPHLNNKEIAALAAALFNHDAKTFMLETLRLGKRMRPNAKWGFYDFPLCDYKIDANTFGTDHRRCHENFIRYNDEMMWLYEEIVALYPPIYLYAKPQSTSDLRVQRNFVYAKIAESKRIASVLGRYTPTYLFSKNEYDEYAAEPKFYTKESRCIAFGIPAYFGVLSNAITPHNFSVQGVVVWSTSENMRARCSSIRDAMQRGLGKFLIKYFHRSAKCNEKLCSGHGRCVTRESEFSDDELAEPFVCRHEQETRRLQCLCDAGRGGNHCEIDVSDNDRHLPIMFDDAPHHWRWPHIFSDVVNSDALPIASISAAAASAAVPAPVLVVNTPTRRLRRLFKILRYRRTF